MWLWVSHWSQCQIKGNVHYCRCLLIIHRRTRHDTNSPLYCSRSILIILSRHSDVQKYLCPFYDLFLSNRQHTLNNMLWSLSLSSLLQRQHSSTLSTCSTAPSQSSALGTPVKPWQPATRKLSPALLVWLIACLLSPTGLLIRNLVTHWLINQRMPPRSAKDESQPTGCTHVDFCLWTIHTVNLGMCSMQLSCTVTSCIFTKELFSYNPYLHRQMWARLSQDNN